MITARRYHWLNKEVKSFVEEPHKAILGKKEKEVLNMVARASKEARSISVDLAKEPTSNLQSLFIETKKGQTTLEDFTGVRYLRMPFSISWNRVRKIYEIQPRTMKCSSP